MYIYIYILIHIRGSYMYTYSMHIHRILTDSDSVFIETFPIFVDSEGVR